MAFAFAAIALAPVLAEDTTKPEAADQTKDQKSGCMGMMGKDMGNMMGMDMGNMMSSWKIRRLSWISLLRI